MTPAEFFCAREFLGLSTQWIAIKLKVTDHTVHTWQSTKVPAYASEFMSEMLAAAEQAVGRLTLEWPKDVRALPVPSSVRNGDDTFPPRYYRAIASRVRERSGVALTYKQTTQE
jgi:hypothetical protein